ncbi:hypothetical protein MKLM6_0013 [Methylomonas koyamae]|nr:hypothetical protein MKLM6_0013 [Methylomonas koyamae]
MQAEGRRRGNTQMEKRRPVCFRFGSIRTEKPRRLWRWPIRPIHCYQACRRAQYKKTLITGSPPGEPIKNNVVLFGGKKTLGPWVQGQYTRIGCTGVIDDAGHKSVSRPQPCCRQDQAGEKDQRRLHRQVRLRVYYCRLNKRRKSRMALQPSSSARLMVIGVKLFDFFVTV